MQRLIAALMALAVAACSPTIVSTAGSAEPVTEAPSAQLGSEGALPSASTLPTAGASVTAAPSATTRVGTFDVIPPGAAIEVAVAELNLRVEPKKSAAKVETLKKGDVLVTLPYDGMFWGIGPKKANGFTWYPVVKLQVAGPDGKLPALPTRPILIGTEVVAGWVATDDGSSPYVRQLEPRCPSTIDLPNVEAMLSAERLACFEGSIVIEGTFGCGGCGGTSTLVGKPAWLADPFEFGFLSTNPAEQIGPIAIHFRPSGVAAPEEGTVIRATVHADDPASSKCTISDEALPRSDPDRVLPATSVRLYCRERLVVDSFESLGMDPRFPS